MYITHHDGAADIGSPTILEGPIFEPTAEEFKELGISFGNVINHVTYGPDRNHDEAKVNAVESEDWDINPELTREQQDKIKKVLIKHKSVFATSLKQIKSLNVEPYSIKVKPDVKPTKVAPRMLRRLFMTLLIIKK